MPAYRVEAEKPPCPTCQYGGPWLIVGPDGNVAFGEIYPDEESAQDVADMLNDAYEAGRRASGGKTEAFQGDFGTKLRDARTAAGMSVRDLAKATDLPHVEISNIERGLRLPSSDELAKLESALPTLEIL